MDLSGRDLCGNTSEPSYVSASFGESCLFLLSGSKRKVKTLESVCPEIGCATTKSGTGLVPFEALALALENLEERCVNFVQLRTHIRSRSPR